MTFINDTKRIFNEHNIKLYGFTSLDNSKVTESYQSVLVYIIPYSKRITLQNYKEQEFEQTLCDAREKEHLIEKDLVTVLNHHDIRYCIPSQSVLFSYKFAAVNAGLGWIGKNDVLITEDYGPMVRISAILLDYNFPSGTPITESRCPEDCSLCVDRCPYHALSGMQWNITAKRAELIDYELCNEKRSSFIKKHGRKNACGLCMVACPIGKL